jgi:RNA polymerase sigma-70 factor (ECF subfamily)
VTIYTQTRRMRMTIRQQVGISEKSAILCDPRQGGRRKMGMLSDVLEARETLATPLHGVGAARKPNLRPSLARRGDRILTSGGGTSDTVTVRPERAGGAMVKDQELQAVELMVRVRDGDREAFALLFAQFAPRVKAFLMKSGTAAAQAEDCAQDVMATLWTKAHLYDPSRASVATWIFTIARNRRIDVIRRQRRPEPEDLGWGPEGEPDADEVLNLQQESARLKAALGELSAPQREIIERAYFGDLTHQEIAAATGLPLGTIKSRIRLALDRLRHAIGPRE